MDKGQLGNKTSLSACQTANRGVICLRETTALGVDSPRACDKGANLVQNMVLIKTCFTDNAVI